MLYSVHSKPSDYSTVSLNIDIPWKCSYIKYYISSINTMSNILYSTTDDTFEFIDDEVVYTSRFPLGLAPHASTRTRHKRKRKEKKKKRKEKRKKEKNILVLTTAPHQ